MKSYEVEYEFLHSKFFGTAQGVGIFVSSCFRKSKFEIFFRNAVWGYLILVLTQVLENSHTIINLRALFLPKVNRCRIFYCNESPADFFIIDFYWRVEYLHGKSCCCLALNWIRSRFVCQFILDNYKGSDGKGDQGHSWRTNCVFDKGPEKDVPWWTANKIWCKYIKWSKDHLWLIVKTAAGTHLDSIHL